MALNPGDDRWPGRVLELLEAIVGELAAAPLHPGQTPPATAPAVPDAPATGPVTLDSAAGQPGARTPLWTLRTSTYPRTVWRWHHVPASTATPIGSDQPFAVPAPGTLTVASVLQTGTVWQVSVDAGVSWLPLAAQAGPADVWTEATITVVDGDHILLSLPIATQVTAGRVVYRPT